MSMKRAEVLIEHKEGIKRSEGFIEGTELAKQTVCVVLDIFISILEIFRLEE